jgi:hypothetical protein
MELARGFVSEASGSACGINTLHQEAAGISRVTAKSRKAGAIPLLAKRSSLFRLLNQS